MNDIMKAKQKDFQDRLANTMKAYQECQKQMQELGQEALRLDGAIRAFAEMEADETHKPEEPKI